MSRHLLKNTEASQDGWWLKVSYDSYKCWFDTFKKDTHFTDLWFEETYNVHILSWRLDWGYDSQLGTWFYMTAPQKQPANVSYVNGPQRSRSHFAFILWCSIAEMLRHPYTRETSRIQVPSLKSKSDFKDVDWRYRTCRWVPVPSFLLSASTVFKPATHTETGK